jgi:FkbM family methyltransferase
MNFGSSIGSARAIADFICAHARAGHVAYDIGAKDGRYTALLLRAGMQVHAFEEGIACGALERRFFGEAKVHVHSVALLNSGGVTFYLDERSDGGQVQACGTLDRFIDMAPPSPALIKIAADGADTQIIKGAANTIRRARPVIIFEMWESDWFDGLTDVFKRLNQTHQLFVLETGEDALQRYSRAAPDHFAKDAITNIGCVPRSAP